MKEQSVPASEFKAKCLRLLDEVETHGREFTITKRGRPVARVTPVTAAARSLRGDWQGIVTVTGDLVHFDLAEDWEANQE